MTPDLDRDWFYVGVTLVLLAGIAGAHNVVLDEGAAKSFGYCDTELSCVGAETSGFCLGVEQRSTQCHEISELSQHRTVEAECGVRAYNLCKGNHSGISWADEATYRNRTCSEWAEQDQNITLLGCDETYPAVQEWEDIR